MGGALSTVQLGLAYCCCNASSSLCNTCLGSTSANTTGRKRSVLLLSITITLALLFQYVLGPSVIRQNGWWKIYSSIPGMGKLMYHSWTDSCLEYNDGMDKGEYSDLYIQCVANTAVYRPTLVSTIFFLISAIATYSNPQLNKAAWPSKLGVYFILVAIVMFIPNTPLFSPIYLTLFRIGAMIFICIQQIILIDIAYNWNETLVLKADEAESQEWGSGKKWLHLIVSSSILLYIAAITGIVLLYKYFSGCAENTIVISLTLVQILVITVVQLFGSEEGSTLTTSVLSAYSTYLAYSVVSKNPNSVCNPTLGSEDISSIIIGLFLTMISLAWTGWSWTAESRIESVDTLETTTSLNASAAIGAGDAGGAEYSRMSQSANLNLDVPFLDPNEQPTTGVVMQSADESMGDTSSSSSSSSLWKLNIVLALISCWVAASLTGWGSITGGIGEQGEHTAANPLVGRLNMAMIAVSQNLAIGLYLWTLIAPKFFPDRDFS
jgi:hypothetical protein